MEILKVMLAVILALFFGYILWRVLWKGAARSWYEEKKRQEYLDRIHFNGDKKGEK